MTRFRGKIWHQDDATEVVEAALIFPLLFMILIAIFWFGQAFRIYGTLTDAARDGARAAVAPVCTTCASATSSAAQTAQVAFLNAFVAENLSQNQLVPVASWTKAAPTECLCKNSTSACTAVACDGSVSANLCVQVNVQLSYPNVQGGMSSCGTSVSARYQYPYSFRIPFTNLDLGNIQLPAQAQMRLETQ
ncbi:MAG: TadE family protein [Candidatus Sulfotelmatobacter sp.]